MAPGHNADGIFTIIQPLGIWIAGDYLTNIEFPYIYHSSYEYENTLKKVDHILSNHRIKILIPGHGDHTTSIREIEKRKIENQGYIQQLRKSLKNGLSYPINSLWKRYIFQKGMKSFHDGNIQLIEKELKSNL